MAFEARPPTLPPAASRTPHPGADGRHTTDTDTDHPRRRPGGSTAGRLMRRSRTRTAGIRFEWAMRSCGPVLRVVATWTDHQGHPHHTSYSVQCNGLEGALDRAIASRTSCGAPMPDREDLLQRLQKEFATAPQAALMAQAGTLGLKLGATVPQSLPALNPGHDSSAAHHPAAASAQAA